MPAVETSGSKRTFEASGDAVAKKRKPAPASSTNPLKEGISQCFQTFSTSLYVSLAPCHVGNPINGIKAQHLDPLVMTYFAQARGVVLAYSNVQLSEDNKTTDTNGRPVTIARIADLSPFVFMWITVDFLVWRPQVGDVLEGYSYMQTASHIGLLVHDTFNASIKKYNIPADWLFVPNQEDDVEVNSGEEGTKFRSFGHWQDEDGNKVEGKLKFTIKSIHSAGKVVSVEGTLVQPGSERDAQPIVRRTSVAGASGAGKHKKFDDDVVVEIPEPKEDAVAIPGYEEDEDEDNAVVNDLDSDED